MRLSRLIATACLTVVLAIPSAALMSSADAAGKPHRNFTFAKIVKLRDGSLEFRAHIAKYPGGFVALMKKTCATCTWNRVALRRTTETGGIALPVSSPAEGRWYWRYRTPETAKFAETYSATWYTYRH
jgi:hypothetical protein